eukprot:scaffold2141_cov282-Pinguiococcus_pyrenoidosus.AAC.25
MRPPRRAARSRPRCACARGAGHAPQDQDSRRSSEPHHISSVRRDHSRSGRRIRSREYADEMPSSV